MLVYGGYTIYAAEGDDGYEYYYEFKNSYFFVTASYEYDIGMNTFFNDRFESLTELIDSDEKFFENEKYKPPVIVSTKPADREAEIREKCKNHLSSFCVAMDALDIYMAYVEYANSKKGELPEVEEDDTFDEMFEKLNYKSDYIDQSIKDARKVMEASIAVYNEYQMAYPMHKQYKKIIESLTKYKLALKDVKKEAFFFPKRFVDATSDQCE
jgi:hypothetical protein